MAHVREREVAVEAVRRACGVCSRVQANLVAGQAISKEDRSPVTIADFASQAIVSHLLAEAFGADPLVAEESSEALRASSREREREQTVAHVAAGLEREVGEAEALDWIDRGAVACPDAGRFWTLDPIDGTKGFLRGGQYAVALALVEEGRVVLGVLGCPNLDDEWGRGVLISAAVGEGSVVQPLRGGDVLDRRGPKRGRGGSRVRSTRMRELEGPAQARLTESVEAAHSDHGVAGTIAGILGLVREPLRIDSQAKYAVLAQGEADIYLRLPTRPDYRERIWDHAAGFLVVKEAGGEVTDVTGSPLDFGQGRTLEANRGVVAANRVIHPAVLDAVRSALG